MGNRDKERKRPCEPLSYLYMVPRRDVGNNIPLSDRVRLTLKKPYLFSESEDFHSGAKIPTCVVLEEQEHHLTTQEACLVLCPANESTAVSTGEMRWGNCLIET